ncbi:MAG: hypothetical protein JSU01_11465 [Bacteroidetes bacterium]|nr:hypothetical protein [Bacteroidota bacterium]
MKARLRKSHKIGIIITCALVAIILVLSLIVNQYWSPILAKQVRKMVLKSSDSLYHIDFSDAELHIVRGEIDIYNINLKPDTAVYNRRKKAHLAPNNLVELHVKRLILSHIHPFKLYFQHKLEIGQVILSDPEINVSYQLNHTKDTTLKDHRTIWQKMSKTLKSIHIGQIALSDVKLKYEDYSGNKLALSELKELSLSATDMLIDSTTQSDRSRTLYCKDIDAIVDNYSGQSSNKLYNYKIGQIHLSTQTSRLDISGLDLEPVKPEVFYKHSYHDRFKIHVDSLQADHFDFVSYHKYRIVHVSALTINTGSLTISANPRQSPRKTDRIKSFPHFALREVNADITVDTIHAHRINITYNEFNQKSNQTGLVAFDNSDGEIVHVTTNKDSLQKNHICTARITSQLMNQGKLQVFFRFDLTDPNAGFTYKGSVGAMNLPAMNQASMPLALVKLNSGILKRMTFDIHANKATAQGTVQVLYHDLLVTVLKPDTAHDRLKHMTIASLFANTLVIKHDNPDEPGDAPRSVYVNYQRPDTVAFWGSIWQTLFAGIKPNAGVTKQVQENIKAQLAQQKQKKVERQIKKAERKQRRKQRRLNRELKKEAEEAQKKDQPTI